MTSAVALPERQTPKVEVAREFVCPAPDRHGRVRVVAAMPSGRHDYVASARVTLDEFLNLDQETGLAEWANGEVYFYMSVSDPHQRAVNFLSTLTTTILSLLGRGTVRNGPYAVVSPSGRAGREPDIFLISSEHKDRITLRFLAGAPDLVVEVVSDDSVERDYVTKFREYEAEGYPEYWIIDPRPGHERADFYVLRDGRYAAVLPDAEGIYTATVFPDVKFKVAWLFEETPPLAEALKLALGDRLASL